jgi:hypothetical protein
VKINASSICKCTPFYQKERHHENFKFSFVLIFGTLCCTHQSYFSVFLYKENSDPRYNPGKKQTLIMIEMILELFIDWQKQTLDT